MSDSNDNEKMTQEPVVQEGGIFNRVIDYILDKLDVHFEGENATPLPNSHDNLDTMETSNTIPYNSVTSGTSDVLNGDLVMMGKSGLDDFNFHDSGLIPHEAATGAENNNGLPANQNYVNLQDHIATFSSEDFLQSNSSNDDIIHPSNEKEAIVGRIFSFESLNIYPTDLPLGQALNDIGHNVKLDASDILDMGNHLVITGHDQDSICFQDAGWTMLSNEDLPSLGLESLDGYNTFVHESGAIVQIEGIIHTQFNPDGVS